MSVELDDRAESGVSDSEIDRVVAAVLLAEAIGEVEVGVIIVGESDMQALNREHRDQDSATDVLSFPIDDDESLPGVPRMLGDVAICLPVLLAQATEREVSPEAELTDLLIHGVLHLLGYDHETDAGEMLARQDEIGDEIATIVWQSA
ncbi:MAG: rRNA maturation RNase YbeY [Thermoleophilia bacterium]|jgi:probable rRNA maturation factor|nr:rRNA maturation RNase YbeY [Thermoleophilia bacterium]